MALSKKLQKRSQSEVRVPIRAAAASAALVLFCSVGAGYAGAWLQKRADDNNLNLGSVQAGQKIVLNESQLINQVAKDVGPSVVSIDVTSESNQRSFFGFSEPVQQQSAGTGVIISVSGVVITNRHVIPSGAGKVSVTLSDGTKLDEVDVIGRTSENDSLDVAFLKIKDTKGKKLSPAKIGDSSKVQVGDKVVAIGNALGQFQNTVTSGIISGFGRNVQASDRSGNSSETLQNLFQTDAAINQGNSGGPLVNISGEVIGLNTAVAGGEAQNIGFAIPINDVGGLIKGVLEKGKLLRAYLGVRYISLTDDYAEEYKLPAKRGAYIAPGTGDSSILAGSPAEKAGLKEKDIITKVNNTAINENNSLTSTLSSKSVGDRVTLTIIRDGKTITVNITLEAAPTQ